MIKAWVYILLCSDGTYYVGCTTDLDGRIAHHHEGTYRGYTCSRRPVQLVWVADFPDVFQAIEIERQLKGWSRRKKEALIRGDFELIHLLAQDCAQTDGSGSAVILPTLKQPSSPRAQLYESSMARSRGAF